MNKVIYVAAPYTHPDYKEIERRMLKVNWYCSVLLMKEQCAILSPLTMGHAWQETNDNLPHIGDFWLDWCQKLLDLASEIHVLKLDGWKESVGVQQEIRWAEGLGIEIKYITL